MALLGSQALCLELASQAEHLPWKQLLGATQTRPSELAESPADNEHKSRAGVRLFFAGDVAMPVRCAYNARNSSPADSGFSSLIVPVVSAHTYAVLWTRTSSSLWPPSSAALGMDTPFKTIFKSHMNKLCLPFLVMFLQHGPTSLSILQLS